MFYDYVKIAQTFYWQYWKITFVKCLIKACSMFCLRGAARLEDGEDHLLENTTWF